jgi:hypothetical protein
MLRRRAQTDKKGPVDDTNPNDNSGPSSSSNTTQDAKTQQQQQQQRPQRPPPPPLSAYYAPRPTVVSGVTFNWLDKLFELGGKRFLSADDLWQLPKEGGWRSEGIVKDFEGVFGSRAEPYLTRTNDDSGESQKKIGSLNNNNNNKEKVHVLWDTLWGLYGRPYTFAGIFRITADLAGVFSPLLVRALIEWVSTNPKEQVKKMFGWAGYVDGLTGSGGIVQSSLRGLDGRVVGVMLVLVLFGLQIFQSLSLTQHLARTMGTGLKVTKILAFCQVELTVVYVCGNPSLCLIGC